MVVTNVINNSFESFAEGCISAKEHAADSVHVAYHVHGLVWSVWAFEFGLCSLLGLDV